MISGAIISPMNATTASEVVNGDEETSNYPTLAMTKEVIIESSNLAATIIVIVCFVVAIVIIELGNTLTIASFVTNRRLRRSKYIPVVSMAVADSLFGLIEIVFLVERYLHSTMTDWPIFSLMVVVVSTMLGFTSALHVVVLAVDRFVAVRLPMSYRRVMTSGRVSIMTVSCWVVAFVVSLPYLIWLVYDPRSVTDPSSSNMRLLPGFYFGLLNSGEEERGEGQDPRSVTDPNVTCYHYDSDDGPVPLIFSYPIQLAVYVATSTTLVALSLAALAAAARRSNLRRRFKLGCDCSTRVGLLACCRRLCRSGPNDNETAVSSLTNTTGNSRHPSYGIHGVRRIGSRAYTMVTVIIVAYIVTWAPYFVVDMVRLMSISTCRSSGGRIALVVTAELGGLNAGVNFFIYAFVNRDFRTAYKLTLKKLFRCCRPLAISDELVVRGRRVVPIFTMRELHDFVTIV